MLLLTSQSVLGTLSLPVCELSERGKAAPAAFTVDPGGEDDTDDEKDCDDGVRRRGVGKTAGECNCFVGSCAVGRGSLR